MKQLRGMLFCLWIGTGTGWGSAFSIHEIGTRSAGMGGAFVAVASDGSALFYNPAGIAFQPGFRMQMDTLFVHGDFRFTPSQAPNGTIVPPGGYQGFISPQLLMVPNLWMTARVSSRWTVGFGSFAPFGLGGNWTNFQDGDPADTKFVARFHTTRPKMESIWMQPTIAYRVTDNLSVAVGGALVHTHVLLEQSILNPLEEGVVFGKQLAPMIFPGANPTMAGSIIARLLPEGRSRFAATSNNIGGNLGILYWHPRWKTRFGFNYRTAVTQHFQGKASFAFTTNYALKPLAGPDTFAKLFPEQDARATFPTPGTYAVGVATEAFGKNLFALDLQVQDYSRLRYVVLNFTQTVNTATPAEARIEYDFHNAYAVRLGWERPLRFATVRAGWALDGTPVPEKAVSPLWPDSTRLNFDVGASKMIGRKEVSLFYQFTKFLPRTTNVAANANLFTNGDWRSTAQLFGVAVRFRKGAEGLEFKR
ncbi:MAG: outer membrane protein transport protein [Acidobacteria bacterium]|nr:outer membrane protein transport protein [Acidobacteriota bacterium]